MQIILVAPDGDSPLARQAPHAIDVPAARPLRFKVEAGPAEGVLRAALRMPSREWERREVDLHGSQPISGSTSVEFFVTGVAPGQHRVHFDVTLATHAGGLIRESRVAGDLVLRAQ